MFSTNEINTYFYLYYFFYILGESTWVKPESLKNFKFGEPNQNNEIDTISSKEDNVSARFVNAGVSILVA